MGNLKITKFGTIHKDEEKDTFILSGFELEGDYKGSTLCAVLDAVIEEFMQARGDILKELHKEMFPDLSEAIKLMDDTPINIEMAYLPKECE